MLTGTTFVPFKFLLNLYLEGSVVDNGDDNQDVSHLRKKNNETRFDREMSTESTTGTFQRVMLLILKQALH